ncbi:hypothetical protein C2W62_22935 [Candidatus Entotheonella serta]|nr:hypothetical protein C2W62_22935 [Candidatus Entotheonella serta]
MYQYVTMGARLDVTPKSGFVAVNQRSAFYPPLPLCRALATTSQTTLFMTSRIPCESRYLPSPYSTIVEPNIRRGPAFPR